jgi:hypothetical protein
MYFSFIHIQITWYFDFVAALITTFRTYVIVIHTIGLSPVHGEVDLWDVLRWIAELMNWGSKSHRIFESSSLLNCLMYKFLFKGAQAWEFFALVFCTKWTHLGMWLRDWGKKSNFLSIDPWFWWEKANMLLLSITAEILY